VNVIACSAVGDLTIALSQRTPAPGGGAAAAVAAALGCAAGAMAARYTTGARYAERSAQSEALAKALDLAASDCLTLADADAAAYAGLTAARKLKDEAAIATATVASARIPADLLGACARNAQALAAFLPQCNPHLVSDVKVGIHLLAGGGRAAWQTLLVNAIDGATEAAGRQALAELDAAERLALGGVR
jgi:formiminotetrahydrofolate cyclodeaminase